MAQEAKHGTICVGIRTLKPDLNCRTVDDIKLLGFKENHVIFESSKGTMGEVTNRLLDAMSKVDADFYLVVDDDISYDLELFKKATAVLERCDATSALPIPDEPHLQKYYREMYGRYKSRNLEPFTFSFALLKKAVVNQVRVDPKVDSREEHAFYREMVAHGFTYKSVLSAFAVHLDKTGNIDARHNRWYAAGMSKLEPSYKMSTVFDLLTSPIEGFFYAILLGDSFGFSHTINLRWNSCMGAFFGYHRR